MKTLILIDKPNWAYERIAQALIKYGNPTWKYTHIKKNEKFIKKIYKDYDQFLVMGWQTYEKVKFLPKKDTLIGIHGHHQWDKRKTTPEHDVRPPQKLHDFLQEFKDVNAVSERLCSLFPYAKYTPNGADTDTFYSAPPRQLNNRLAVGCAYNPKHDWRKGVSEFIAPAVDKVKAELRLASRNVQLIEMANYYNSLSVYVCASSSEGMSLSVLEAMACGIPVISTWPSELETINVKRSVNAIAEVLKERYFPTPPTFRWGWDKVIHYWKEFIDGSVFC